MSRAPVESAVLSTNTNYDEIDIACWECATQTGGNWCKVTTKRRTRGDVAGEQRTTEKVTGDVVVCIDEMAGVPEWQSKESES